MTDLPDAQVLAAALRSLTVAVWAVAVGVGLIIVGTVVNVIIVLRSISQSASALQQFMPGITP